MSPVAGNRVRPALGSGDPYKVVELESTVPTEKGPVKKAPPVSDLEPEPKRRALDAPSCSKEGQDIIDLISDEDDKTLFNEAFIGDPLTREHFADICKYLKPHYSNYFPVFLLTFVYLLHSG